MLNEEERNLEFIKREKSIYHGFQLAEQIVSDDPTTHYLVLAKHHGDVMRQMRVILLLKEYYAENASQYYLEDEIGPILKKLWIIKRLVVITKESLAGIVRLFPSIDEIITLSNSDLYDIGLYAKSISCVHTNLHKDELANGVDEDQENVKMKLYGMATSLRWSFNLPLKLGDENENTMSLTKVSSQTQENALNWLRERGIPAAKTVILLPYAVSTSMLDESTWTDIIMYLKKMGFYVFTNTGKNESALQETERLSVPFDVLVGLGYLGATMIGVQSGATDIIRWSDSDTRVIALSLLFAPKDLPIAKSRRLSEKKELRENNCHLVIEKDEVDEVKDLVLDHFSLLRKGYYQKRVFSDSLGKTADDPLYQAVNLNDYIDLLLQKEDLMIFISVYDSADRYWNEFDKSKLGLESDLSDKWRKSYVAVIDTSSGDVSESMMKNYRKTRLQGVFDDLQPIAENVYGDKAYDDLPVGNYYYVLSHALGKNRYSKSKIVINGADYSVSKRGLNIVSYSKKECRIIDSVNVDTFGDPQLTINRMKADAQQEETAPQPPENAGGGIVKQDREKTEWLNYWFDRANLLTENRILLIGDSVTRGYRRRLGKIIKRPVDCFATSSTLYDPIFWKELDLFFSVSEYRQVKAQIQIGAHCISGFAQAEKRMSTWEDIERDYEKLLNTVLQYIPDVVIATATNIVKEDDLVTIDEYLNSQILRCNEIAVKIATKYGLKINDLYTAMKGCAHSDFVHFTEAGYDIAAQQTAKALGF